MIWKPKDPIYFEKGRRISEDYYVLKDIPAVCRKWDLSERMVRHYLKLMEVKLPPRKRDKHGRFVR